MLKILHNESLLGRNTFRMKVSARCLVEFDAAEDLQDLDFSALPRPVKVLGGGSNLLFSGDFPGTLLHPRLCHIRPMGDDGRVEVGAGVVLDDLCAWAAREGLWGTENLSGIPGEVGAVPVQNPGAYGVEAGSLVESIEAFDLQAGNTVRFSAADCAFGYRDSLFKHAPHKDRYLMLSVQLRLSREPRPVLDYGPVAAIVRQVLSSGAPTEDGPGASSGRQAFSSEAHTSLCGPSDTPLAVPEALTPGLIRDIILGIRADKLPDPADIGSAGSFFKNPLVTPAEYRRIESLSDGFPVPHYDLTGPDGQTLVKIPAAYLIERCGWKGVRDGGAAVYDKQALVLVNASGVALPREILSLRDRIVNSVEERFGIRLQCEVEVL